MHIMLDLETLGTKPGSVIRSIDAATFDPRGIGFGNTFYQNIDKQSCLDLGLTVDSRTEKWWSEQKPEVEAQLLVNVQPLGKVLAEFSAWYSLNSGAQVWCQGANFDAVLLDAAFALAGMITPWTYYNVRDTRTVYEIAAFSQKSIPNVGDHHNALDDCKFQINCVQTALRKIQPRF